MTAQLWLGMLNDIRGLYSIEAIPFSLMQKYSRVSKVLAPGFLKQWAKMNDC